MNKPEIGTVWKNKTQNNEFITIVNSSTTHSRKNIAYKYHRTGHIGGYNSAEWFYSDWKEVTSPSNQEVTLPKPILKKIDIGPKINPDSWWTEMSSGNVVNVLSNDNPMIDIPVNNCEIVFQYKTGSRASQVAKCDKTHFENNFQHKFG